METKRCPSCQKLLRIETEYCSRCGRYFSSKIPSRTTSRPSIPPASPHRAGHYSGLHPEDQPYQSSMIAVQHPVAPLQQRTRLQQEPEQIFLPAAATVNTPAPVSQIPTRKTPPPPVPNPYVAPRFAQPSYPRKPLPQSRLVPILLTISCILLLIGTSLLAFLLLNRKPAAAATPVVTAEPGQLRVGDSLMLKGTGFGKDDLLSFTRDSNVPIHDSDGKPLQGRSVDGTFLIHIPITSDWEVGQHILYANDETEHSIAQSGIVTVMQAPATPPSLRLSQSNIDLGTDVPGATSSKFIILTNAGGGRIQWHSSTQQSWLSVTPRSGTFSGEAAVTLTVNRGNLLPQIYTGQITFMQDGSSNPFQLLTVTMTVKAPPTTIPAPSMALSQASLSYSTTSPQNPPNQTIILQDTSSQPLDWSASAVTGDGASWLSITPGSGHLNANSSVTVTTSVQSQGLSAGSYSAIITFTGAGNFQVPVSLTVTMPGNLVVSPSMLPMSVISGQSVPNTITLQNSGGLPLNWTVSAGSANWLSMTPTHGTIAPNTQVNGTININASALNPGSYSGKLTFTYGSSTRSTSISLTVSPVAVAAINVQPTSLNFSAVAGSNPNPQTQTFTISDSGTAPLNWSISEDSNGTSFAPVNSISGSLTPTSKGATITVTANVAQQGAGTITAHITIFDSDKGSTVQSQQVTVTITITSAAVMNLSTTAMSFSQDSVITYTQQLVQINNTGSAPLDWSISPASQPSAGLTLSSTSGTIPPGQNAVIYVTCASSNLSPGTYNAAFVVSDSDPKSPVASQTVNVTVTVS